MAQCRPGSTRRWSGARPIYSATSPIAGTLVFTDGRTRFEPIDAAAILKMEAAFPGVPGLNEAFAELKQRCIQELQVAQPFLLAAVADGQTFGDRLEARLLHQKLVRPRPPGLLAAEAMRHADHGAVDEAATLDETVLTAYLTELADLPPIMPSLTNQVPRTVAPSAPADEWKYAVAAMQDHPWLDPTDPLRAQPPPAPPSAVQLLDWEVGEVSGEGRALIDFCPSPDPRVREHAVALLDGSGMLLYSAFLPLSAHQITFEGLRWDEPYQVMVNSIDAAGRWSFTSAPCTFTFHSPSADLLPTAEPSPEHIYIGQTEDHLLVATAIFAEPVPGPPPVTTGWWCTDCHAFVLLAAERVGGLCLECGGRETTWREG